MTATPTNTGEQRASVAVQAMKPFVPAFASSASRFASQIGNRWVADDGGIGARVGGGLWALERVDRLLAPMLGRAFSGARSFSLWSRASEGEGLRPSRRASAWPSESWIFPEPWWDEAFDDEDEGLAARTWTPSISAPAADAAELLSVTRIGAAQAPSRSAVVPRFEYLRPAQLAAAIERGSGPVPARYASEVDHVAAVSRAFAATEVDTSDERDETVSERSSLRGDHDLSLDVSNIALASGPRVMVRPQLTGVGRAPTRPRILSRFAPPSVATRPPRAVAHLAWSDRWLGRMAGASSPALTPLRDSWVELVAPPRPESSSPMAARSAPAYTWVLPSAVGDEGGGPERRETASAAPSAQRSLRQSATSLRIDDDDETPDHVFRGIAAAAARSRVTAGGERAAHRRVSGAPAPSPNERRPVDRAIAGVFRPSVGAGLRSALASSPAAFALPMLPTQPSAPFDVRMVLPQLARDGAAAAPSPAARSSVAARRRGAIPSMTWLSWPSMEPAAAGVLRRGSSVATARGDVVTPTATGLSTTSPPTSWREHPFARDPALPTSASRPGALAARVEQSAFRLEAATTDLADDFVPPALVIAAAEYGIGPRELVRAARLASRGTRDVRAAAARLEMSLLELAGGVTDTPAGLARAVDGSPGAAIGGAARSAPARGATIGHAQSSKRASLPKGGYLWPVSAATALGFDAPSAESLPMRAALELTAAHMVFVHGAGGEVVTPQRATVATSRAAPNESAALVQGQESVGRVGRRAQKWLSDAAASAPNEPLAAAVAAARSLVSVAQVRTDAAVPAGAVARSRLALARLPFVAQQTTGSSETKVATDSSGAPIGGGAESAYAMAEARRRSSALRAEDVTLQPVVAGPAQRNVAAPSSSARAPVGSSPAARAPDRVARAGRSLRSLVAPVPPTTAPRPSPARGARPAPVAELIRNAGGAQAQVLTEAVKKAANVPSLPPWFEDAARKVLESEEQEMSLADLVFISTGGPGAMAASETSAQAPVQTKDSSGGAGTAASFGAPPREEIDELARQVYEKVLHMFEVAKHRLGDPWDDI